LEDIVRVDIDGNGVSVVFYVEDEKVMEIGQRLEEINENAYMNGENWSAVLTKYLEVNDLEAAELMDADPEAGLFAAYFALSDEGRDAAERTAEILRSFVTSPDVLYGFVEQYGDEIEWD